jgi:hypothetical protein
MNLVNYLLNDPSVEYFKEVKSSNEFKEQAGITRHASVNSWEASSLLLKPPQEDQPVLGRTQNPC